VLDGRAKLLPCFGTERHSEASTLHRRVRDPTSAHLQERAVAKIPDKAEHQRRFAGLDFADRRAIIRAVNRGQVLEDRKLAALAVGVARRQQRFWRVAWLIGPALGLLQLLYADVQVALINGGIGTLTVGGLSLWWYTRARRAEQLNTEAVEGGRPGRDGSTSRRSSGGAGRADGVDGSRPRGHLPGRRSARGGPSAIDAPGNATPDDAADTAPGPLPPGERPYKPRGRKRRR
jgi:hypothetical protein